MDNTDPLLTPLRQVRGTNIDITRSNTNIQSQPGAAGASNPDSSQPEIPSVRANVSVNNTTTSEEAQLRDQLLSLQLQLTDM